MNERILPMTFIDIQKKATTFKGEVIDYFNQAEINKNIIDILQMCIKKQYKIFIK